jgi:uncharacterized membrane protein YhhN
MSLKNLLITYMTFSIIYIIGLMNESYLIMNLSKALPMLLLVIMLTLSGHHERFLIFGFFFSMLGDIFLLKAIDQFLLGLGSFFIAHVFYIIVFYRRQKKIQYQFAVIYYLLGIYIFYMLMDHLGDLMIPVIAYIFVITTMAWFAKNQSNASKNYQFAYYGALLFIISDTILALNRFTNPIPYGDVVVITTYFSAQWLIFRSAV